MQYKNENILLYLKLTHYFFALDGIKFDILYFLFAQFFRGGNNCLLLEKAN